MVSAGAWLSVPLAWAGLYLVVFLLLTLAGVEAMKRARPAVVEIDPIPQLAEPQVKLSGRARPSSLLEVGVDARRRSLEVASPEGGFQVDVPLSAAATRVWVRALTLDGEALGIAESKIDWKPGTFPLLLDLCVVDATNGWIWIAGRGNPEEQLVLEGLTTEPYWVAIDSRGILDLLTPNGGATPNSIIVHSQGARRAAVNCQSLAPGEAFPLARRTTIVDRADSAGMLDALRSGDSNERGAPLATLVKVLLRAEVEVTLPTRHPYYRALAAGEVSEVVFLEETVGALDGLLDSETAIMVWKEAWGYRRPQTIPVELLPSTRVSSTSDSAKVQISLPLFTLLLGYGQVELAPGSGRGIASRPLHSSRDSFEIRPAFGASWAFDEIPDVRDLAAAAWKGPRGPSRLSASRAPPQDLLRTLQQLAQRQSDTSDTNLRDALATIDRAVGSSAGRASRSSGDAAGRGSPEAGSHRNPAVVIWETLLTLVPAIAVIWLLRRRASDTSLPGTSALMALALVIAAVLAWPAAVELTRRALVRVPGFAASVALPALPEDRSAETAAELARLLSLPSATAWLVLIALLGTLPFSFAGLSRALDGADSGTKLARRSWHLLWRVPVALYAAMVLATLWRATSTTNSWRPFGQDWDARRALAITPLNEAGPLLLVASLLLCFGLRGIVSALLFGGAAWIVIAPAGDTRSLPAEGATALAVAALGAVPLVARLLSQGVPGSWPRRSRTCVAVALVVACVLLPAVPTTLALRVAAGIVGLGLLWAVAACYGRSQPGAWLGRRMTAAPLLTAGALFAAGAALGWPFDRPHTPLRLGDVAALIGHWGSVLPYLLAIGLVLLVVERIAASRRQVLTHEDLVTGMILYAAFLVSPTTMWLLIPVPLLVAVALARAWLFVTEPQPDGDSDAKEHVPVPVRVRAFLDAAKRRGRAGAAIHALDKELESAKIGPAAYTERRHQYEEMAGDASAESVARAAGVFALGDDDVERRVGAFLRIGLLIASAPILISLYEYLPLSRVTYPYPVADFLSFLVAAILKWGLYALFLGLFFANLRGKSGLTKGLHLFVALAVPFAAYRLLGGPSAAELRPFLFWLAQLFVFCGGLGLVAGDLRLLHSASGGAGDLRTVHRLPALYAFLSAAAAAIVPAVLAAVAGKLGDVVKFFMQLVVPGTTGSP